MKKQIAAWVGVLCLWTGSAWAADWHVATNGSDLADGTSWSTAKLTIQAGVDGAADGDTVWVSNGVYAAGGQAVAGDWTNRVALTKPILVQSVNGPKATVITGGVVRCAYVTNGAVLSGFTLTGGRSASKAPLNLYSKLLRGGGVWCEPLGVVTNCILQGNWANWNGGGASGGTLNNCLLIDNWSDSGGGTYESDVNDSIFSNNYAGAKAARLPASKAEPLNQIPRDLETRDGGAARGGTLTRCVLQNNMAFGHGGGTFNSKLKFCTVKGNWAAYGGASYHGTLSHCVITSNRNEEFGIIFEATLDNCLIMNNHSDEGGMVIGCSLMNCTIVSNSSYTETGGAEDCTLTNCIVYGNSAGTFSDSNHLNSTFVYSCTAPNPGGAGNYVGDPQFANEAAGDYRLSVSSPCLDAGDTSGVYGEKDLDGRPRIAYGAVDMGAYEAQLTGPGTWFTTITNGLTSDLDCVAGDGVPNLLKYATGSSPRIADSMANLDCGTSSGVPVLMFYRNPHATDVNILVEGADEMTDDAVWRGLATNINGSWSGATNVSESAMGVPVVVTVEDSFPLLTNRFLRLKVTRP